MSENGKKREECSTGNFVCHSMTNCFLFLLLIRLRLGLQMPCLGNPLVLDMAGGTLHRRNLQLCSRR